jgi:hypothetical protein
MAPKKSQVQKFRDIARQIGADESEDHFSATLRAVARHKPSPEAKRPAAEVEGHRKKR